MALDGKAAWSALAQWAAHVNILLIFVDQLLLVVKEWFVITDLKEILFLMNAIIIIDTYDF